MKKYSLYIITIPLAIASLVLLVWLSQQSNEQQRSSEDIVSISNESLGKLITEKCVEDDSNVYMTECTIKLLDRVAAEREWKQRKLETATDEQINIGELIYPLQGEQAKIAKWRVGFEEARDKWCAATVNFYYGSGTPLGMAMCKLRLELQAVSDLNDVYVGMIDYTHSSGIPDFEPSNADIDTLTKVNATTRECVLADEDTCQNVAGTLNSSEALVERYGVLQRSSTSGDMRFDYYDIEQGKTLESLDGKYPWFFATIKNLENDKAVGDYSQYVQDNKDSVFKITGKKEADDCEHFGDWRCLENITIKETRVISEYPFDKFSVQYAPLDLKSHPRGLQFKTVISNAYKKGPNFAGHYVVAEWGCGTGCQNHVFADTKTGKIIDAEIMSANGVEYKIDSRLFIANPQREMIDGYDGNIPAYTETEYYVVSDDGLRLNKLDSKPSSELIFNQKSK